MELGLLEQVVLGGKVSGGDSRGDAKLAIERGDMMVDGTGTDHKVLGDLRVSPALSEQAQDLHLPHCQAIGRGDRLVGCLTHWWLL